jgi:Protein of unknown function (DUF3987)
MADQALPTYEVRKGLHRFRFPDGTQVEVHRPARDRLGRLWAEITVRAGEDRLLNRARFDLLDLRARDRFSQGISADARVDWQARLLFALEHVARALQEAEADAEAEQALAPPTDRVEPFPVGALPIPLARFTQEAASALPCPPDFIGVLMLPLLGTAIGTSRVLEVKPGWYEGPRMYAAVVAEPGSKKSPALDLVTTPYQQRQRALHTDYLHEKAQYQQAMAQHEADLLDWKQRRGTGRTTRGDRPHPPHEPVLPQVFTTDATLEALAALLEQNPRGVAFIQDEFTGWVLAMNQYKDGRGADRHRWLSFWNGAPIVVNRKTRKEPIVLNNPFVGVAGCLPPDMLSELTDERGWEDGFVHRLLFAFPDPLAMHWTEAVVDEATLQGYGRVLEGLWTLQGVSPQTPRVSSFTPAGRQSFIEFANALYAELAEPDFPETLRGPFAKLEGYGARLALLLHLCRYVCGDAHTEQVDERSVLGAAALVHYFKSHSRRVYSRLHATPAEQRVIRALHWFEGHGARELTMRELLRAKVGGCTTRHEMELLLEDLVDRGFGHIRARQTLNGMTQTIFVCKPVT